MKRAPPIRANTAIVKFGGTVRNLSTLNGDERMLTGTSTFIVRDAAGGGLTAVRGLSEMSSSADGARTGA